MVATLTEAFAGDTPVTAMSWDAEARRRHRLRRAT